MKITFRLAKPSDAPIMAKILSESWEAAYKDIIPMEYITEKNKTRLALFQRIITDDNDRQYIIEANKKPVGIMCVAPPQIENIEIGNDSLIDDSFYELHGLYHHPDYYRKGIGTKAMEFAIDKARKAGKKKMILWVFAENTSSINFYKKCGFLPDSATKTYNCGKEMKCIRMRREL